MLTVLIEAGEDEAALARTLNSLIAATIEGVVREVVLLGAADNAMARRLADQSGGAFRPMAELRQALAAARGEWLMLVEAGLLPEPGWLEHVATHVQAGVKADGAPVRFARSAHAPRGLAARLLKPERPLALGLIVSKAAAQRYAKEGGSFSSLAASFRARSLAASARPAR